MDAARREELSRQQKARWAMLEALSAATGVHKRVLNGYFYKFGMEVAQAALDGSEGARARIRDDCKEAKPKTLRIREKPADEIDDASRLNIALWFIRKAGGVAHAERAFRAAKRAMQEMDK